MTKIKVKRRNFQLKSDIHISSCFVYAYKTNRTFEIVFISMNWIFNTIIGNTETGTSYNVFCIFGNKRRRVITGAIGNLNNLYGFKSGKINSGHTRRIICIYEYPSSIHDTIRLGNLKVMQIIPWNKAM